MKTRRLPRSLRAQAASGDASHDDATSSRRNAAKGHGAAVPPVESIEPPGETAREKKIVVNNAVHFWE